MYLLDKRICTLWLTMNNKVSHALYAYSIYIATGITVCFKSDFSIINGPVLHICHVQFNEHFLKKIPQGAEASNILVGELEFLKHPLIAFVRLQKAVLLGDLTEVPVPTRFIFVLLGPLGNQMRYHEIGRSIATLMSDEVLWQLLFI